MQDFVKSSLILATSYVIQDGGDSANQLDQWGRSFGSSVNLQEALGNNSTQFGNRWFIVVLKNFLVLFNT